MALNKKAGSDSLTNKTYNTRGRAAADKSKSDRENESGTAGETKKTESKLTKWLSKDREDTESAPKSSPAKARATVEQPTTTVKKTQQKLSGYLRTTKSTANVGREEVREVKTKTAVKETTYELGHKVTREHKEIITDTTTFITKVANPGKKRKRVEVDDTDYIPDGPASKAIVLADVDAEDQDGWTTQRPRRKAAKAISSYAALVEANFSNDPQTERWLSTLTETSDTAPPTLEPYSDSSKSLILTLAVPGLAETVMKTEEAETTEPIPSIKKSSPIRKPIGGWDNSKYRFKFNWSPYQDLAAPTHEEAAAVFEALRVDLASRGRVVGPGERGPAHGSTQAVTVDAMVRTLLSQATNNENALFVQHLLTEKFTYTVDGKEVQGCIPNYHKVLDYPEADLAQVIQPGGIHNKRARFIKSYLSTVYEANTTGNSAWDGVNSRNAPNAADFVPGLLSLSFLDGKPKVELFNWLLSLDGVGVKTAHCVMEFNYRLPVCAVDTHVLFMSAALGWLPADCMNADDAAMHLDARLPDDLKHDLHQAFWNHRQHCGPCRKATGDAVNGGDAGECVLEEKLQRRVHRSRGLKAGGTREKKVVVVKREVTAVRKASTRPFDMFTAEKAAEEGYEYREIVIDDDFAAGSVNKCVKKMWVLKSE